MAKRQFEIVAAVLADASNEGDVHVVNPEPVAYGHSRHAEVVCQFIEGDATGAQQGAQEF